jgi:RNA polymerase sigma factor (sigma-70 family)
VVQETAIGVARHLPEFIYDPKVCRFKTWLLNLTRWRIQDQLRKRQKAGPAPSPSDSTHPRARSSDDSPSTATINRIPDPAPPEFGAEWDEAWEKNLFAQALERVRDQINERQFQIFDLNVMKGWPASNVAQTLGISAARIYLTKHRVSALLKKEVRRLEQQLERQVH